VFGTETIIVMFGLFSPALMVLASTAENHEGARMPFPNQNAGDKEISSPYTTPFTMYRPGEPYPAQLELHFLICYLYFFCR
jgi:hypothetical protein